MGRLCFRKFPQHGVVALFYEADGGGKVLDINSMRNRPAATPEDWLDVILFHSGLDYLQVAALEVVEINHDAVAAASPPSGLTVTLNYGMGTSPDDHLLIEHNLGYVPFALVAFGDNFLTPAMPVQTDDNGGGRYATVYATTTELRLYEFGSAGTSTLPAAQLSYTVIVFKDPPAAVGNELFKVSAGTGRTQMALGKFDSNRRYLQLQPGGTPLGLALGRTADVKNGAQRFWRPDGTHYDPVPPGWRLGLNSPVGGYGALATYNGDFDGDEIIEVRVP